MVMIKRWFTHTFMPPWRWRMAFPSALLKDIEQAVKQSEVHHSGELRFAIENSLPPARVWKNYSARQRATEVFSTLHVWDTEDNSGILIYILLADREVHIVADRGITRKVNQSEWDAIASTMKIAFSQGDFRQGSLDGITSLTRLLATHFPPGIKNPDELSNKPVIVSH
jgi:uncharacterized membrane protein